MHSQLGRSLLGGLGVTALLIVSAQCFEDTCTTVTECNGTTTVRRHTVYFNHFIPTPTTITLTDGASLAVDNAPTMLDTTVVFTQVLPPGYALQAPRPVPTNSYPIQSNTFSRGTISFLANSGSAVQSSPSDADGLLLGENGQIIPNSEQSGSPISMSSQIAPASLTSGSVISPSAASSSSASSVSEMTFLLSAISNATIGLQRRQDGSLGNNAQYLDPNSQWASQCNYAAHMTIANGSLLNGNGRVATYPGVDLLPFMVTLDPLANITTYFSINEDDQLSWANTIFDSGYARYCNTTSGAILAVFHGDIPRGCEAVVLMFAPLSECDDTSTSMSRTSADSSSTGMLTPLLISENSLPSTSNLALLTKTSSPGSGSSYPALTLPLIPIQTLGLLSSTGSLSPTSLPLNPNSEPSLTNVVASPPGFATSTALAGSFDTSTSTASSSQRYFGNATTGSSTSRSTSTQNQNIGQTSSTLLHTTVTSYLDNGEAGYTSTVGGYVIIAVDAATITSTTTIAPYQTAYTSTITAVGSIPGIIILGSPAQYTTQTTYLDNGEQPFTSIIAGNVVVGKDASTLTTISTLAPYQSPYTSTVTAVGSIPGTVLLGSPAYYTTTTTYLDHGEASFTSTTAGNVLIGIDASTTTTTTFIGVASGYSSTIYASGSTPGTVIVGYQQGYQTSTTTGTYATTQTVASPSGTQPGTILIVNNPVASAQSIIVASNYQQFCSNYLGYTQPYTTLTATATAIQTISASVGGPTSIVSYTPTATTYSTIPSSTQTIVASTSTTETLLTAILSIAVAPLKRGLPADVGFCGGCDLRDAEFQEEGSRWVEVRQVLSTPTPIPSALATFSAYVLSSACSAEVTQASITSTAQITVTASVSTRTTSTGPVIYITSTAATITTIITLQSGVATTTSTSTSLSISMTTTTVILPSGAPTGIPSYLQIIPQVNSGAGYCLSDPGAHLTDNYFKPSNREIFIVSSLAKLYSVTHAAYYYRQFPTGTNGELSWSTSALLGDMVFYQIYNSTLGYNELKLNNTAANAPYLLCNANVASGDANTNTGYHIYYATDSSQFPLGCDFTRLFIEPISLAS
ncbi:MAG: hypothetical protein M1818_008294 [Claussenomyces sp. TS43310]|nr:MAG: hypothetical protein M1818_008294 [Claussenomyces sp. TS43310]